MKYIKLSENWVFFANMFVYLPAGNVEFIEENPVRVALLPVGCPLQVPVRDAPVYSRGDKSFITLTVVVGGQCIFQENTRILFSNTLEPTKMELLALEVETGVPFKVWEKGFNFVQRSFGYV